MSVDVRTYVRMDQFFSDDFQLLIQKMQRDRRIIIVQVVYEGIFCTWSFEGRNLRGNNRTKIKKHWEYYFNFHAEYGNVPH